jgi:hypothetical protein
MAPPFDDLIYSAHTVEVMHVVEFAFATLVSKTSETPTAIVARSTPRHSEVTAPSPPIAPL